MTKSNIPLWSQTANSNSDVGGNNVTGTGLIMTADDSFREIMAQVAKFYADLGGVNTVAGTGDVITVTTAEVFTALTTGLVLSFKASATNTTDATINVDGLGAKHIHKFTTAEVALVAGDLVAGQRYMLIYDAAANSAAGAWLLADPSGAFLPLAGGTLTGNLTGTTETLSGLLTLNGGQIAFPASQNPSAGANVLDDYEEGQTTPVPTSGTGTFTTVSSTINYTKIGRMCLLTGNILITTNGTASVSINVATPFTAAGDGLVAGRETAVNGKAVSGFIGSGTAVLNFVNYDNSYPGVNSANIKFFGGFPV